MKIKTSLMMMTLGGMAGAATCAYLMSNNKTKNKANAVINNALDDVNHKLKNMKN